MGSKETGAAMEAEASSVRVAIRIRPLTPRETIDMCRSCTCVSPGEPQVWLGSDKAFTYDHVFDTHVQQHHVYDTCVSQLMDGCLRGYNATVLAYGQTGSGKTYTMGTGFDVESADVTSTVATAASCRTSTSVAASCRTSTSVVDNQPPAPAVCDALPVSAGIIARAVTHLFAGVASARAEAERQSRPVPQFSVTAQFMELYNEEVIDLLDSASSVSRSGRPHIRIHEDASGSICAAGVTSHPVTCAADCLRALRSGALSRSTASTRMNAQSSRSHAIFSLIVTQRRVVVVTSPQQANGETVVGAEEGDGLNVNGGGLDFETLSAKFHFVDLAGSERLKRTGATGDRAKEGISINCGLLALGNVISALGDESKRALHVPYRDSKLTRLLQDSLGGNSRTLMIACVSPSDADFMETLNTLKYANRARNIKNRVLVNQDKSSRMVAVLRAEIQQLKLELLEYKQGKRVVSADGDETVNDMYHENVMLNTDNAHLRTRIKALQETVERLTARATQLQASQLIEQAAAADGGGGCDMDQMISGYISEVEQLRAQLIESQQLCHQLQTRQQQQQQQVGSNMSNADGALGVCLPAVGQSPGTVQGLIDEARRQLRRDMCVQSQQSTNNNNNNTASASAGGTVESSDSTGYEDEDDEALVKETDNESDNELSTDEQESEGKELCVADYNEQLAALTGDISLKQRLIEELERSQHRLVAMRSQYEDKLQQLTNRIKSTEQERDQVLENLSKRSVSSSDETRKVKSDYERKLTDMAKEMKKLQTAKKEHAKLLKSQTQYERQIRAMKDEVVAMKTAKVKLMHKMKEDANRMKQMDMNHHRVLSQLKKDHRKHESQITSLQNEKRIRDAVLRRKQEEISVLRRLSKRDNQQRSTAASASSSSATQQPRGSRRRVGGGVYAPPSVTASSPAACKKKWQQLEQSITQLALNKQTVSNMEREMERQLKDRDGLRRRLCRVERQRRNLTASSTAVDSRDSRLQELDETVEAIQANMKYVNENISECQDSIMAMEESKEGLVSEEPSSLLVGLSAGQMEYLLHKLVAMTVHQSCAAAQHEISCRELEQRMRQVAQNSSAQQQLLRHLMTEEGGVDPTVASLISEAAAAGSGGTSGGVVGGGVGDTDEHSPDSDEELVDVAPPWAPGTAGNKARSRTATTSQLLFASQHATNAAAAAGTGSVEVRLEGCVSPAPLPHPGSLGYDEFVSQAANSASITASHQPFPLKRSLSHVISTPSIRSVFRADQRQSIAPSQQQQQLASYKQSLSPRLSRRHHLASGSASRLNIININNNNNNARMHAATLQQCDSAAESSTPPSLSPVALRRSQSTRDANVFSRLTSGTSSQREREPRLGVISAVRSSGGPVSSSSSSCVTAGGKSPLVCTHVASGHSKAVLTVCATDDTLFSGSKDRTVKVWDLNTGRQVHSLAGHPNNVVCVRYSSIDRLVFSVSSAFVKVWDVRLDSTKCIKTLSSSGLTSTAPPVATPSRTLLVPSGETQVTDVALGRRSHVLYMAAHNCVRVWDLRRFVSCGKLSGGHQAAVMCLAVGGGGGGGGGRDLVLTGSKDHRVKLFDVPDQCSGLVSQCLSLEPPHYDGVQCLAVHDSHVFSGSRDACLKMWRLQLRGRSDGAADAPLVHSVNNAHCDWICGMTVAPRPVGGQDSAVLVSGCRAGFLRLWSVDACRQLGELRGHNSPINAVTANNSHLFSASNDHSVKIWRVRATLESDSS